MTRVDPHVGGAVPCQHERVARTIVIVDDHDDFRSHAARMLTAGGYDVVGSCADGHSAVSTITALHPDVVLLDVQLPDIDGFAVIEQVERLLDGGPVVVLTSTREAIDYGARVAQSGAAGFISKAELSARSVDALVGAR
jgi:DNA-binding NarL/FixJ family response regulator